MKAITIIGITFIVLTSFKWKPTEMKEFNHAMLVSSGAPYGYTGAPGDFGNCTSCHAGSPQSGTSVINLTFSGGTQYALGTNYTITVSLVNANAKNGFEIVALRESDNTNVGTWATTDANTQMVSGGGRNYVTHTGSGNTLTSWTFDWQAPATDVGSVRFYLANNISNNNGATSGDVIYLSQLQIHSPISVGIAEKQLDSKINMYVSHGELTLQADVNIEGNAVVQVYNLNGQNVFSTSFITTGSTLNEKILLPELPAGMYIASFEAGGQIVTRKIYF